MTDYSAIGRPELVNYLVRAEADRDEARARVAVLEQQIAAVRDQLLAMCDDADWRYGEIPSAGIPCLTVADVRAALAAGVVDNPTEGSPS